MSNLSYEEITAAAIRTLRALAEESTGQLLASEDNLSWWDMARGVFRCWEETVGDDARREDRRQLELLIDDMPGADVIGKGNWHLAGVVLR